MPIYITTNKIKNILFEDKTVLNIWKDTDLIYTFNEFERDYTLVDCLVSNGTQWLNLNYPVNSNVKVQAKIMPLEATGGILIGDTYTEQRAFRVFNYQQACYLDYGSGEIPSGGGNRIHGGTLSVNTLYELELGNRYVKNMTSGTNIISGSSVSAFSYDDLKVGVFFGVKAQQSEQTDVRPSKGKIYYCKVYDNNVLVRDMVACKRKVDNVLGMYDKVNKVFYTNAGTGTFTYE